MNARRLCSLQAPGDTGARCSPDIACARSKVSILNFSIAAPWPTTSAPEKWPMVAAAPERGPLPVPPRVKRSTAELIESFKVIGIDNAPRVNKSYEPVCESSGGSGGGRVRGDRSRETAPRRGRWIRDKSARGVVYEARGQAEENLVVPNPVIFPS